MGQEAGRIVLVEDLPFAGVGLGRLLRLYGYEVREAGGYDGALAELRSGVAPAALLVTLAGGVEAFESFRNGASVEHLLDRIGVIGFVRMEQLEEGALRDLGIDAVVDVNAIPEELIFRINELLFAGRELRRFARVFTDLPVNCSLEQRAFDGRITNMGQGGAFVQTDEPIRATVPLRLRFRLPGGSVVSGDTTVKYVLRREPIGGRVQLSGAGVEFTKLDPGSAENIASYVQELQNELRGLLG